MNMQANQNDSQMQVWRISSDVATAEVYADGGALHNLTFALPNGTPYSPLAEAPWQRDYLARGHTGAQPRHIELLGGEWPCVPFGTTQWDPAHHGFGTDHTWALEARTDNQICLSITYPKDHVVARVERKITLPMGRCAVELELTIHPRRTAVLPIGLHPILRIPEDARLTTETYDGVTTPPSRTGFASSTIAPDLSLKSLTNVPLLDGRTLNVAAAPKGLENELLQLWNTQGHIEMRDLGEGVSTHLEWDKSAFPHCLLWFANSDMSIGSTRFRGIGIEPINSFFDSNDEAHSSAIDNPKAGLALTAGTIWSTTYRIACDLRP